MSFFTAIMARQGFEVLCEFEAAQALATNGSDPLEARMSGCSWSIEELPETPPGRAKRRTLDEIRADKAARGTANLRRWRDHVGKGVTGGPASSQKAPSDAVLLEFASSDDGVTRG